MRMHKIPRRQALRQLALLAVGCTAACTPLRVLVSAYPQSFDEDDTLVERVLRAFVTAVIPGARPDDPDLVRAHLDPAYPFAQYAGFFTADLSRRAGRAFGGRPFERLELAAYGGHRGGPRGGRDDSEALQRRGRPRPDRLLRRDLRRPEGLPQHRVRGRLSLALPDRHHPPRR